MLSEETVMKALLCTDVQIKFRGGSADVAGTFRNYSYGHRSDVGKKGRQR